MLAERLRRADVVTGSQLVQRSAAEARATR
jgi:hypothetical protein